MVREPKSNKSHADNFRNKTLDIAIAISSFHIHTNLSISLLILKTHTAEILSNFGYGWILNINDINASQI